MKFRLVFVILLIFLIPGVFASDHYSFEHAESLKDLIEWRAYGPESFSEAVEENKPIFLLLTAPSWCYWCQVYESEDYLFDARVVDYINENFIPIYVDADKRQDITRQYLEGGWPSTTVLTPSRERIYGYSGPRPVSNMLTNLKQAVDYVRGKRFSDSKGLNYQKTPERVPAQGELNNLVNSYFSDILRLYDPVYGGFGSGQKFPQGRTLDFSLELYESTLDSKWLVIVQNTLKNQYTNIDELETDYNLFDPVEGGFHRYGTKRGWTPPHYEKMLYDNARLLRAYSHLQQIAPDDVVEEVVSKTLAYIAQNWYDENGGFYGNTDVHGEDHYYGKNPRLQKKPRVEKTKYTDWNSEAILTYLYLWEITGNEEYKTMASKSLGFFSDEMVSDKGAYHYYSAGEKGVRGSLLDNSYLLLAFVEAYEVLGDDSYLDSAKELADYSLDNLYDWNSGGFFERNSPDIELYAPGDHINLRKPSVENGIISYAMVKLYSHTSDLAYLNAGIKTLGAKISSVGSLDFGYYYIKAAQYVTDNNLLDEFSANKDEINSIVEQKQKSFWLSNLGSVTGFVVSDFGIDSLDGPILVLLIIALIAGLVSFASPCTLPILPAFLAFSLKSEKHNIKGMTLAFFLGLVLVFTLLGMSASFVGGFLKNNITIFSQIAGIGIVLFGALMIFEKGFSGIKLKHKRPRSYFGSFLFGGALGISWTPCVGPILVALLLLASTTSSFLTGGLLLFVYGIGLAVPLVVLSSYFGKINREGKLWRFIRGKELRIIFGDKVFSVHTTSLFSGLLFIILGYLIFSGILFSFNQYVVSTGFQKWIFDIEESLLGFVR